MNNWILNWNWQYVYQIIAILKQFALRNKDYKNENKLFNDLIEATEMMTQNYILWIATSSYKWCILLYAATKFKTS